MWHKLKAIHVNSRVYEFSLKRLHKQSGVSRNGLRKYIQFFKEAGWVREEGKDLVFISHRKMMNMYCFKKPRTRKGQYYKTDFALPESTDHKQILSNLRFEIPRDKQKKFSFVKQKKDDLINPVWSANKMRNRSYQAARKYFKGATSATLGEVPKYYTTSVSTLANRWAVSSSTASRYIKKFEKEGRVKVRRQKLMVSFQKDIFDESEISKPFFFHKGFLFKRAPNQYFFKGCP